jgi:hypothetical protein
VGTLLSMIRHGMRTWSRHAGFMRLHANRALADEILEVAGLPRQAPPRLARRDAERASPTSVRARGRSFLDAWERVIGPSVTSGRPERTYSDLDRAKRTRASR